MKKYFTQKFLFFINSVQIEQADRAFLVVGLVLLALAAVLKLSAIYAPTPVDSKFRNRLFKVFSYTGFGEILWFAFRYENIRFFGSHFVAMAWLLIGLIWLVYVVVDLFRRYSREKNNYEKEQVRLKYLQR